MCPLSFKERSALLFVPTAYRAGHGRGTVEPLPLVFNYHGFINNAGSQRTYSQMNELAEEEGFLALYPAFVPKYFAFFTTFAVLRGSFASQVYSST